MSVIAEYVYIVCAQMDKARMYLYVQMLDDSQNKYKMSPCVRCAWEMGQYVEGFVQDLTMSNCFMSLAKPLVLSVNVSVFLCLFSAIILTVEFHPNVHSLCVYD